MTKEELRQARHHLREKAEGSENMKILQAAIQFLLRSKRKYIWPIWDAHGHDDDDSQSGHYGHTIFKIKPVPVYIANKAEIKRWKLHMEIDDNLVEVTDFPNDNHLIHTKFKKKVASQKKTPEHDGIIHDEGEMPTDLVLECSNSQREIFNRIYILLGKLLDPTEVSSNVSVLST